MRFLSTLAVALFLASTSSAADYYLDASTGDDANPGTSAQPWRTITFALGQSLASGDVLRLRGTFAAPAESFPLSLLPGVSLTTWDASSTARIDAGASPCIRIIRPGDHTEEIVGTSGSLVIVGAPAVRIEAPNEAMRCTTRIAGCRIEGALEAYVAYGHPGYSTGTFHPLIEDCTIVGDVWLFSDSEGNYQYDHLMVATLRRNLIQGSFLAQNPENFGRSLTFEENDVSGTVSCIESRNGDAGEILIARNIIRGGELVCDGTQSSVGLLYGRVLDNQVLSGGIRAVVSKDAYITVSGNRCAGDIYAGMYYMTQVDDNTCGGSITAVSSSSGSSATPSASRNRCSGMDLSIGGPGGVTVEDNVVVGGTLLVRNHMVGLFLTRNEVHANGGDGIRIEQRSGVGSMWSDVTDNRVFTSFYGLGTGIWLEGYHLRANIGFNKISGFGTGIEVPSTAQIGYPFFDRGLFVESNCVSDCGVGIKLGIGQVSDRIRFKRNVLASNSTGLEIARGTYQDQVEAWGNIFAGNSTADITPGSLLPSDDVRGNLAEDGSLLDFHPSNISGDPHFVDAANGDFRLRPTSPCIAPGNNPAGGDIGRFQSGLQPTLEVVELGGNLASFRTHGENGDHVILFIAAYPARPAALTLCDGLLGLDAPTILAVLPGIITFGRWDLIVDVPPNLAFTAVLQSLRVDLNAPNECSMTNTRFFRR